MNSLWSSMAKRAEPYIPGEQLNKNNILKLNTNENPYPPSPKVIEAITEEVGRNLRLYPSPTMETLRQSIGTYYGLKMENVFIGNGSDEVLAFSFMAFFEPEKEILFPNITYSFYPVYAKLFDIPYKEVKLKDDFSLDIKQFFNSKGGVIFPNPNAPTSIYLPLEHVETIVKNNPNKAVIVDEAYIDYAPESAVSLVNKYDNLLVIQTMSKSRALAGLRIGFALGNEKLIHALIRIKDSFNSYPVDRLAMAGATAAINDKPYFEETTEKIIKIRGWTTDQLEELGFQVLPSATNFVFASHQGIEAETLYKELRDKDILIRYFGKEPIDNFVRITIGTDEEMQQLIEEIKHILI
ncbi:histidinol-phosphate transaminase [Pseudogracilibacillus sp. SE30717A]|uniref:histidinol-phosphate transaminase n=1 Tax=Pseudogracilibacillus sp. SE30717A TaxID=3098293 RepID=UPI00300E4163